MTLWSDVMRQMVPLVLMVVAGVVQGTYPAPSNPCSQAMLAQGKLYHAYPGDPRRFIQCDQWGKAYIQDCPADQQWDTIYETCVEAGATTKPGNSKHHSYSRPQQSQRQAADVHKPRSVARHSYSAKKTAHTNTATKSVHTETKPDVQGGINHDYPPPANFYGSLPNSPLIHLILLAANQQAGAKQENPPKASGGQSNDEICAESGNRYLPDRKDMHWYYECKGGVAVAHSCGPGLVWVQPLQQCMKLEVPLDGGGSQDDSAVEVSDLGRHNPCHNSGTRYHPWPGHPAQYLECRGRHAYLWSCAAGQLWSQELQACVIEETVETPPDSSDTHNPCPGSSSYYHPLPDDPARFIQCDQFGNMFPRKCGPNKVWDDFFKTCVGRLNMSKLASSSWGPDDSSPDDTHDQPDTSADSMPDTLFGCPDEFQYDASLQLCIKIGDDGEIDNAVNPASYHTSCPSGYRYDSSMGMCVQHMADDTESRDPMGPHCSSGMNWNSHLHMCVPSGFLNDLTTTDHDAYTSNHNAIYGYNDITSSAARQARDVDYSRYSHYPDTSLPEPPATPPIAYEGENPCGHGGGFYFPFPHDPRYYIQCDQMGRMYIKPCHYGHIWNDDLATCVPDLGLPQPPSLDPNAPPEAVDIHHVGGNPCRGSTHTYHPFANNDQLFIMCVGNVAYPMPCPYGARWNDNISTCYWPKDNDITDTIIPTDFPKLSLS